MFKRYVSIIASVLLAVTFLLPATSTVALANTNVQQSEASEQAANFIADVEAEGMSEVILNDPIEIAIKKTAEFMMQGPIQSEWEAIGLTKAGFDISADYEKEFYDNFENQVLKKTGKGTLKITDVERIAIAAVAIGKDATNIKHPESEKSFDLIEKIYNTENWTWENSDSMTYQGNNGPIFALIALDAKNYSIPEDARWNKDKILAELLSTQLVDGSWSLANDPPGKSSFDITSMALIGLAPHTDRPEVKKAVDDAINFMSENQGETGGFNEAFVGGISSEATAQTIIGLTANNVDPKSEKFTKNGINLIDHLLSFEVEDGGFKHTINEAKANGMATEQALQGLVAYDLYTKGEGRLYDFSKEPSQPEPEPDLDVEIEQNSTILKGLLSGNLLKIQKNKNENWAPIAIENAQTKDGYFIVQAGEKGSKKEVTVPTGMKKVFVVENDRSYRYFEAEVVVPNKPWTITFNATVKNTIANLEKIYVEDIQGNKVPVNVTASGDKVTVIPKTNYKSGQLYSLFIVEPESEEDTVLKQATRKLFIIK